MNNSAAVSLDQVSGQLIVDVSEVVGRLARTEAGWYRENSDILDRAAQGLRGADTGAPNITSSRADAGPVAELAGTNGADNDRFPSKSNEAADVSLVNSETPQLRRPFTGLGDDVDEMVSLSPTLTMRFNDIQRRGWVARYGDETMMRDGDAMRMGYADLRAKTIVIDDQFEGDTRGVLGIFNHEVGHSYKAGEMPDEPSIVGETRDGWATKCTDRHLDEEGRAILSEWRPLDEITSAKNIFIPMSGPDEVWPEFEFTAADHDIGAISERDAIAHISRQLGECVVEGVDKTYREMLMGRFGEIYDSFPRISLIQYGPRADP